jgi:hypothetical protein
VTIEALLDGGWHQRMPNNDGEIIDQAVGLKELTGRPVILAACDYAAPGGTGRTDRSPDGAPRRSTECLMAGCATRPPIWPRTSAT